MRTKIYRLAIIAAMVVSAAASSIAEDKAESFVVEGEHFTVREINDPNFNNMIAYRFSAPKDWKASGQVYWNLRHITRPSTMSAAIENPANSEACYVYQPLICGFIPGKSGINQGKDGLDGLILPPMTPVQAMTYVIKKERGQYADLKFIGSRDLPDLAKAFNVNLATTQHGIGVKVTYTLDGKPVEEEFYGVHYYQMVQGEALWGVGLLHSFRAPVGMIDKRRAVLAAIPKSFKMTEGFGQRIMAVKQRLSDNYKSVMRQNYAEIAAARQRSQQLTASENQFLANVDRSLVEARQRSGGGGGSGEASEGAARTGNDTQDDYIRGVVTMNDPVTGTSQHDLTQQYHWTDGYGNYRNSNDASYDPNHVENGNWQLMTPAP
jgi:hypothetical protein